MASRWRSGSSHKLIACGSSPLTGEETQDLPGDHWAGGAGRGWTQSSHTGHGGPAPCCCPGAGGVSEGKPLLSFPQAPSGADRGQAPGNQQTGQEDAHAA